MPMSFRRISAEVFKRKHVTLLIFVTLYFVTVVNLTRLSLTNIYYFDDIQTDSSHHCAVFKN